MIEEPVLRSYRRKAKIVFYVTWVITGLLAATVAASKWHPILALLAGLAFGLITGAIAGAIVAAWPVIRAIWWWTPETVLTGEPDLRLDRARRAHHPDLPAGLRRRHRRRPRRHQAGPHPHQRRSLWCLITRHRIRTCFSEFIITNRTGSLPLILWAMPTPVGERVWIWLRPGLCPG